MLRRQSMRTPQGDACQAFRLADQSNRVASRCFIASAT